MSDEPISDIKELNDLRMQVLRGEDIPPEKYLEVLIQTKKLRRAKGDIAAAKPARPKIDMEALFGGLAKPRESSQ